MLVKLFGATSDESSDVPASGPAGCATSASVGDVRPRVLRRPRPRRRRGRRRGLRRRRPAGDRRHDHASARSSRWPPTSPGIYEPLTSLTNARVDLMTAVGLLRAGVRGARRAGRHRRPARGRRPRRAGRAHRARPRVVPLPAGLARCRSPRSRRPAARRRAAVDRGRRASRCCTTSTLTHRAGPDRRPRRPVGRGQDHARLAGPPALRRHRRRGADRRPRRARPHPALAARGHRRRHPGPAPLPRVGRPQPALRPARRHRSPSSRRPAAAPRSTT